MVVKSWRFITILLVSLTMAMSVFHLLQLPARINVESSLWITLQAFDLPFSPLIGIILEVCAWIATVVLAFLVRQRRPAYRWTLIAMMAMGAAQVAWWLLIFPANQAIETWTPATMPIDWTRIRDQWEYTHVVRAVLHILSLSALVISLLVETPATDPGRRAQERNDFAPTTKPQRNAA